MTAIGARRFNQTTGFVEYWYGALGWLRRWNHPWGNQGFTSPVGAVALPTVQGDLAGGLVPTKVGRRYMALVDATFAVTGASGANVGTVFIVDGNLATLNSQALGASVVYKTSTHESFVGDGTQTQGIKYQGLRTGPNTVNIGDTNNVVFKGVFDVGGAVAPVM